MLSGFFAQTHSQHEGCSWVLCQTGGPGGREATVLPTPIPCSGAGLNEV